MRPFAIDPRNRATLEGRAPFSPAPESLAWCWRNPAISVGTLVAGVLPLVLMLSALTQALNHWKILSDGAETPGVIVRKWLSEETTGEVASTTYHRVLYRYTVGGKDYTASSVLPESEYARMSVGSPVRVRHGRYQPEVATIGEVEHPWPYMWFMIPFALICGFIVAVPFILTWWTWKLRRLVSRGRILPGTILSCTERKRREGYTIRVTYSFFNPEGKELRNTVKMVREDLANGALPRPGTPMAVVHEKDWNYMPL